MDLLYALDDRFQSGTDRAGVDRPDRPPARRRHGLADRRRRLRPLPHAAPGDRPRPLRRRRPGIGTAGALRRAGRQRARHPDGRRAVRRRPPRRPAGPARRARPGRRRRADRDPGQGRRRARRRQRRRPRRRRRRRAARRPRAGPLHRLARAASCGRRRHGDGDHRHRLQPRPGPPLAQLAGRRRVHRGRRPGVAGRPARPTRPTSACRCSATPTPRRPSPCRTARCGPGRRPTASRSPTAPRTARAWPSTATRRRRGSSPTASDPIGEQIRLDVAEPIDHLTLQQPDGAAAVRHIGQVTIAVDDRRAARRRPRRAVARAGRPARRPRPDHRAEHGDDHDRRRRRARPDASGRRWPPSGSPRSTPGSAPTIEVVRPPADAVDAIAAAGDTPVSFVLTRLRTRPTDRWRSDPEPTMVREIELPDGRSFVPDGHGAPRPAGDRRRARRAARHRRTGWRTSRLTGVADRRRVGRRRRRPGDGVDHAVRRRPSAPTLDAPRRRARSTTLELTQPGGDHSPITGCGSAGGTAVDVAVPPPDADGHEHRRRCPTPVPAGDRARWRSRRSSRASRSTAATPSRSCCRRPSRAVGRRTAPSCRRPCRHRLPRRPRDASTAPPSRCAIRGDRRRAARRRPRRGDPLRRRRARPRRRHPPHRPTAGATTGLDVDRVVLADSPTVPPAPSRREPDGDGHRAQRRTSRDVTVDGCPDGCWLVLGEGFHESWSASTDGRRPRPAAARRRRLQRVVDRAERRPGRRVDPLDGADPADDRPRRSRVLAVLACVALAVARPAARPCVARHPARPARRRRGPVRRRACAGSPAACWVVAAGAARRTGLGARRRRRGSRARRDRSDGRGSPAS